MMNSQLDSAKQIRVNNSVHDIKIINEKSKQKKNRKLHIFNINRR